MMRGVSALRVQLAGPIVLTGLLLQYSMCSLGALLCSLPRTNSPFVSALAIFICAITEHSSEAILHPVTEVNKAILTISDWNNICSEMCNSRQSCSLHHTWQAIISCFYYQAYDVRKSLWFVFVCHLVPFITPLLGQEAQHVVSFYTGGLFSKY